MAPMRYHRNLTLIYVNSPMVKLVLLHVILLKIAEPIAMLSEYLMYSLNKT